MKRFLLAIFLFVSCAAINVININLVHASTQDFTISSFKADYYLGKDSEGRSTLKTVESITADFPQFDQNHGIERAIPQRYDGHSVGLQVQSVEDQLGGALEYETSLQNGNLVLRIGNADTYVHGQNTYVITYTQRDVTRYFSDTDSDEFYWDINGVGWSQPFSMVEANIHIDPIVADNLSDKRSCYVGASGSTSSCSITQSNVDKTFSSSVYNLEPGENMTIAIGFQPKTFVGYQMTAWDYFLRDSGVPMAIIGTALLATVLFLRFVKYRSAPGRKIIIAEYTPPKDIDISVSAMVGGYSRKTMPAMLIDLAVKRNIRIVETVVELFFKIKIKTYKIELLSTDGISPCEREVLRMFFGNALTIGSIYFFSKPNTELAMWVQQFIRAMRKTLNKEGYSIKKTGVVVAIVSISVLATFSSPFLMPIAFASNPKAGMVLFFEFAVYVMVIISLSKIPLSNKGRELYDYLKGIKLYIKTAEIDRIKMLQTPSGAEKVTIDANDKEQMIKLYEKLLPYAIMFGLEKEWSKVLAVYYTDQGISPVWYVGTSGFSSSSFTSSLSSFSSSIGASSSSGGSSGGGSSGGGGGGGGGGGW